MVIIKELRFIQCAYQDILPHEQVLFGGNGEALTIRQDSFDRESFMSGVKVALEKVSALNELVIGLENIL